MYELAVWIKMFHMTFSYPTVVGKLYSSCVQATAEPQIYL